MPDRLPALFVSHGAPTLAADEGYFTHAWRAIADALPKPRAILVVSAHWDTDAPMVSSAHPPRTIHDFSGFPPELYEIHYPAPGAPHVAARVDALLRDANLEGRIDPQRGLDHGAWVPLLWMYPSADIPVTQLSVQSRRGAAHHLALGRALAPLRDEGVLVLGSGGVVHNLRELDWHRVAKEPFPWSVAFNEWVAARLAAGELDALADYRRRAPEPARAHPTEEHFVPLFAALGAGGLPASRIDLAYDLGSLGMDCYRFG
ncbi:4,5-DOPA dioxygenase extradiol [Usitatibacter palustris]|uniref:4,5-DOPA dioxygenase extradiol n=1 Tax=Usitatibacter palustris TaxID=2732487 RepID=A0A6M4H5K6_9PROT|nr:4,5-DOPA dioxygenase extradiol [Usitatibacter palustris]QJR13814.1 4,5-DOPA dioxygenase extradiol [Usitatibacter palustris]